MRAVSPPGKNEGAAMPQVYNTCHDVHGIIAEKSRRIPL